MNEIKKGWNAALTHDHFKPKIITVALKMTEIFNLKNLEKKEKKNLSLAKALICGGCVNSGEINFEFRIIFSNWWRKFTLEAFNWRTRFVRVLLYKIVCFDNSLKN